MTSRSAILLRTLGQALVASLMAYALLIQSLALPVVQIKARQMAQVEALLGVVCATDGTSQAPGEDTPKPHSHSPLDCCLAGGRFVAFEPVILASSPVAFHTPIAGVATVSPERHGARAPPVVVATPLQPRAPPISA
jgi:hypothetical protein